MSYEIDDKIFGQDMEIVEIELALRHPEQIISINLTGVFDGEGLF